MFSKGLRFHLIWQLLLLDPQEGVLGLCGILVDWGMALSRQGFLEKGDCVFAPNLLKQDYTTGQSKIISAFISHKSLFFSDN